MTTRTPHQPASRLFALALAALLTLVLAAIPIPCQSLPQAAPSAQTPPAPQAFEVASIRLSAPSAEGFSINGWGTDQFTARNATLQLLISFAYNVQFNQMEGEPGWLNSQRYDIEAKSEGGHILTFDQLQTPLRLLLEQRFHLAIHRYTKEAQGYALVVAKGGPKLQPSKEGEEPYGSINPHGLESKATNLNGLAKMLVSPAGRPIIDKTGIAGTYDFKLHYATVDHPDPNLPDLFTAVQEQLGLKLVPQKVPVEILVIDHVDKIPTEN
jgi:uncharacterized protein (TIGR03435 family)